MRIIRYIVLIVLLLTLNKGIIVKGEPLPLPNIPNNIKTTANDNKIVIAWDKVENAHTYEIEVDGTVINNSLFTIFEHENLLPLTTHTYRVRAVNETGNSEWSSLITQKTANPKLTELNMIKVGKEIIEPRYGFGTVALNNKIYIVGGYGQGYMDTIEEYDSVENLWEIKTTLPTQRVQPCVVAHNNKLYIVGGYNSEGQELSTVDVYDIEKDQWTKAKSMPTKRSGAAAVQHNNKIYVIGGYNQEQKALDTVEVYDIATDSWTTLSTMPTKRSLMEAVIYNSKIYVMGGYNGFVLGDIEIYDIEGNTWEQKGQMPIPRHSFDSLVLNEKIMIVGGYNTTPFNTIELYNPNDNRFIHQNALKDARYASGAVIIQDELYVIGGTNEARPINIVEKAYIRKDDAPSNFNLQESSNNIQLTWDKIQEDTIYELEINGVSVNNGFKNTYTHEKMKENTKYYYRVRGITDKGITQWSPYRTYLSYSDQPSAYAYIGDRIKDKDNYETLELYIMTKNIEDIYAAEIECTFNKEHVNIASQNINQLIFASEKNPYQYTDYDEKKGRIYLNVSLIGNQRQNEGLNNLYKITLHLKTLDATKINVNTIKIVDSIGHIIDIADIYDLDIPSLY